MLEIVVLVLIVVAIAGLVFLAPVYLRKGRGQPEASRKAQTELPTCDEVQQIEISHDSSNAGPYEPPTSDYPPTVSTKDFIASFGELWEQSAASRQD